MNRRFAIVLLLNPFFALAQQAFAPVVLAAAGQTLYSSGAKSTDSGLTWKPMYLTESGLPQPLVRGILIDAADPNTLYAHAREGLFKSADSGTNWRRVGGGLPAADTLETLRQAASGTKALYFKAGTRIYKSTDSGETWSILSQLPGVSPGWEMSVTNPNKMYAVEHELADLDSLRIYTSDDEGRTWRAVGAPDSMSRAE